MDKPWYVQWSIKGQTGSVSIHLTVSNIGRAKNIVCCTPDFQMKVLIILGSAVVLAYRECSTCSNFSKNDWAPFITFPLHFIHIFEQKLTSFRDCTLFEIWHFGTALLLTQSKHACLMSELEKNKGIVHSLAACEVALYLGWCMLVISIYHLCQVMDCIINFWRQAM